MLALIALIAVQLGVDARLAQELAIHENPKLIPEKIGYTGDLGIFQLNPEYLDFFIGKYWDGQKKDVIRVLGKFEKFDWKNPRHNSFVGISILRDLIQDEKLNVWQALIAYNCGRARVLRGDPPERSIIHANSIFAAWQLAEGVVLQ